MSLNADTDGFVRFPRTPHLAWLGGGAPRSEKVLTPVELSRVLENELSVEEKVDGSNVGLSLDSAGHIRVQQRGSWLVEPFPKQFKSIKGWLLSRDLAIRTLLQNDVILFGEWLGLVHSIYYDKLPDWLLAFDIYMKRSSRFLDRSTRDELCESAGIKVVRQIAFGRFTLDELKGFLEAPSAYGSGPVEGIYVKTECDGFVTSRYKLVRADFTQAIEEHWRSQRLRPNRLET